MVKKIAKYGGKWDFWGQTAILLTSYFGSSAPDRTVRTCFEQGRRAAYPTDRFVVMID
jgi:hypothetical protein